MAERRKPAERHDFFISYTSSDGAKAQWIAAQLEGAGYTTIIQVWDFAAGGNIIKEISDSLACAGRTVLVLSPSYLESRYAQVEWTSAIDMAMRGGDEPLPVRVAPVELPPVLSNLAYVDIVGVGDEEASRRLLEAASHERPKPARAATFTPAGATIFSVPLRPLPTFGGRDELLDEVGRCLAAPSAPTVVAFAGLGGIGKSRLAAEFAHRQRDTYDIVWWVPAHDLATASTAYRDLASAIGLMPNGVPTDEIVPMTRRALEQRDRWLLVFDDAQEPAAIDAFIPTAGNGDVLITSRNHDWGDMAVLLRVPLLERSASVRLLLVRATRDEDVAADELAEALGDLPLALQQAGAYMAASGETATGYLELLHESSSAILAENAPIDYRVPVAATWNVTLAALKESSPAAVQLLDVLAFLAPEPLPRDLLHFTAAALPEPLRTAAAERSAFNRILLELARYALIDSTEGLTMHRLLQQVIRDAMSDSDAALFADAAARSLERTFPDRQLPPYWPLAAALTPHALATTEHAARAGVCDALTVLLLVQVIRFIAVSGAPGSALALADQADALAAAVEMDDGTTISLLSARANAHVGFGQFHEAERLYALLVTAVGDRFGPESADLPGLLSSRALALYEIHDLDRALECAQRALALTRSIGPPERVPFRLNLLGMVLQQKGDLAAAEAVLTEGLQGWQQINTVDDGVKASLLNNLGVTLRKAGRLDESREHVTEGVRIVADVYGPEHYGMVRGLQSLGRTEMLASRPNEAAQLFRRALSIGRATLPETHAHMVELGADLAAATAQ